MAHLGDVLETASPSEEERCSGCTVPPHRSTICELSMMKAVVNPSSVGHWYLFSKTEGGRERERKESLSFSGSHPR